MNFLKKLTVTLLLAAATLTVACTPEEQALFNSLPPAQQDAVVLYIQQKSQPRDKYQHVLSDAALSRLAKCESGGNYSIVSKSGKYRGAFQFDRTTWNSVASRHYPHLRGVDPAGANVAQQNKMARALYAERGRQPWPHCGKRI